MPGGKFSLNKTFFPQEMSRRLVPVASYAAYSNWSSHGTRFDEDGKDRNYYSEF
jgi:hypothetical protein